MREPVLTSQQSGTVYRMAFIDEEGKEECGPLITTNNIKWFEEQWRTQDSSFGWS